MGNGTPNVAGTGKKRRILQYCGIFFKRNKTIRREPLRKGRERGTINPPLSPSLPPSDPLSLQTSCFKLLERPRPIAWPVVKSLLNVWRRLNVWYSSRIRLYSSVSWPAKLLIIYHSYFSSYFPCMLPATVHRRITVCLYCLRVFKPQITSDTITSLKDLHLQFLRTNSD